MMDSYLECSLCQSIATSAIQVVTTVLMKSARRKAGKEKARERAKAKDMPLLESIRTIRPNAVEKRRSSLFCSSTCKGLREVNAHSGADVDEINIACLVQSGIGIGRVLNHN